MKKEIYSLKNGNYHIRIDCLKSDKDYIKNNILNSKLAEWYNLSNIDWDECDKFANKNIIKEMADYINKYPNVNYDILSKKFYISKGTVAKYLEKAKDNGMISDALRIQIMDNCRKRNILYVYDKNKKLIKIYVSLSDFVKNSIRDFGFKSSTSGAVQSVKNKSFYHNSVYLSYEPLN